ncbi:MAG: (Fe-S)-binding protein [Acidimicrobiales bacterium]
MTTTARGEAQTGGTGPLLIDDDDLAACVSCGLCLAHCPTYRVSGEEGLSPRGRITAMRAAQAGAPLDAGFERLMETCVQCRACETACPATVPFGRMMEAARAAISWHAVPRWQRAGYRVLGHHGLLVGLSVLGGVAQRLGVMPAAVSARLALPSLPLRRARLRPSGDDVWLFTGCVMDAWQREVHAATQAVVELAGAGVAFPGAGGDCCGALHCHAGLTGEGRRLAGRVMASMPGERPVLVNSAGCGAALKEYGRLRGSPDAERFSARVFDVHEWLAARIDQLPPPRAGGRPRVVVADPCHLRHAQRAEWAVRAVLGRYFELVELDDEGRCCGAGGAFAALQPELAGRIRTQKLAAIGRAGAGVVASANPGCSLWLAAAGVPVRHPMELVAEALGAMGGGGDGR